MLYILYREGAFCQLWPLTEVVAQLGAASKASLEIPSVVNSCKRRAAAGVSPSQGLVILRPITGGSKALTLRNRAGGDVPEDTRNNVFGADNVRKTCLRRGCARLGGGVMWSNAG